MLGWGPGSHFRVTFGSLSFFWVSVELGARPPPNSKNQNGMELLKKIQHMKKIVRSTLHAFMLHKTLQAPFYRCPSLAYNRVMTGLVLTVIE